jgi:hypothetical protein
MGVAEGCRLQRDVPKDGVLTYADVVLPAGRLIDRLRAEQAAVFFGAARRYPPRALRPSEANESEGAVARNCSETSSR